MQVKRKIPVTPKLENNALRVWCDAVAEVVNGLYSVSRSGTAQNNTRISNNQNTSTSATVTKESLGLSKVDNTSDIDKPISKIQEEALKQKVNNTEFKNFKEDITYIYDWDIENVQNVDSEAGQRFRITSQGTYNGISFNEGDIAEFYRNSLGELALFNVSAKTIENANKLTISRNISFTGGATGNFDFDGSSDVVVSLTLNLVDNLTSTDVDKALTANQGKLLKDELDKKQSKSSISSKGVNVLPIQLYNPIDIPSTYKYLNAISLIDSTIFSNSISFKCSPTGTGNTAYIFFYATAANTYNNKVRPNHTYIYSAYVKSPINTSVSLRVRFSDGNYTDFSDEQITANTIKRISISFTTSANVTALIPMIYTNRNSIAVSENNYIEIDGLMLEEVDGSDITPSLWQGDTSFLIHHIKLLQNQLQTQQNTISDLENRVAALENNTASS